MPVVSVVIPTYNHQEYVLQTLDSVFAQTYTDYEVIVVNDGSPDSTADALRPLADAGRIRYIAQPNAGQAAARNRGIAAAQGEYIALLDDDDLWPPDKLAWQMEAFARRPDVVMVYGCALTLHSDPPEKHAPPPDVRERGRQAFEQVCWIISPGATLIRADALRALGGFDTQIWGADDWDLYLRLGSHGRLEYADREALLYRVHEGNASKNAWRMFVNCRKVYRKHWRASQHRSLANWLLGPPFYKFLYSNQSVNQARNLMQTGQWGEAARAWMCAARIRPRLLCSREAAAGLLRCRLMQARGRNAANKM